jgi:hypothetical protein
MSREPEDIHAGLVALADGTLPEQQRASLLARLEESPELAAELADQRRAVAIVHSLERVQAPSLLRQSIELAAAGDTAHEGRAAEGHTGEAELASPWPGGRGSRRSMRRSQGSQPGDVRGGLVSSFRPKPGDTRRRLASPFRPAAVAVLVTALAIVVALALVLTKGGASSAPTMLQAAGAGLWAPTRPAPAESSREPHRLAISAAGIAYPYWGGRLGWQAAGARADTLAGRTVTTVFYRDGHDRWIAYSIVSGDALAIPAGSAPVSMHGVNFHVVSRRRPTIVTWREAGHTCILTARDVGAATLMHLVAWERA